jgi:ribosomal subunit interface protein
MDIVFKGRHTDVLEKFREHATGKLAKVEKLDHKAIRVDVEVSTERNPRQAGRKERVELTITTRGPAIRAEANAEDRFAALDIALARLEARLRRACDRRKNRHAGPPAARLETAQTGDPGDLGRAAAGTIPAGSVPASRTAPDRSLLADNAAASADPAAPADAPALVDGAIPDSAVLLDNRVPIDMQGEGPLVIREKFHVACPMTIDQALFEMELVGHDFFLFTDTIDGLPSVVYRRRGYQYGVLRLVEEAVPASPGAAERAAPAVAAPVPGPGLAIGQSPRAANLATG